MKEESRAPLPFAGAEDGGIEEQIRNQLGCLIDPETGLDFLRMGLVRNVEIEEDPAGKKVTLVFRPSSPVCPMAFKLAWDLKSAVKGLNGVAEVDVKVENYNRAAELEAVLKEPPG